LLNKLWTTCLELPLRVFFRVDNSFTYSVKGLFCWLNWRPWITVILYPWALANSNSGVGQIP
jgi:hypothetical protein